MDEKHQAFRPNDESSKFTEARKREFSDTTDTHGEIRHFKQLRTVDRCNVLLDKFGTRNDENAGARCYQTQVNPHQADDETISEAVVGSACIGSMDSNQNYLHRICKMGLANFVHERDSHGNAPTAKGEIDELGQGNSCGAGSGQLASSPETPLVQVRAVHCRLDGIADGLRRGCEALERDVGLRGRSFLVPAEWGAEGCRCAMEALAMEVFMYHTRGMAFDRGCSGAEWWVQVSHNRADQCAFTGRLKAGEGRCTQRRSPPSPLQQSLACPA